MNHMNWIAPLVLLLYFAAMYFLLVKILVRDEENHRAGAREDRTEAPG